MRRLGLRASSACRQSRWAPLGLRTHHGAMLQAGLRSFHDSSTAHEYPKEGVFQPNSPRPAKLPNRPFDKPDISSSYFAPESNNSQVSGVTPPVSTRTSWLWSSFLTAVGVYFFVIGARSVQTTVQQIEGDPQPGSEEDKESLQNLAQENLLLPFVQHLLSEDEVRDNHLEPVTISWIAYSNFGSEQSKETEKVTGNLYTAGTLKGSRGLAVQRLFFHQETGLLFCVLKFGSGVCSAPGVVHTGAIATVFDEFLGRIASRTTQKRGIVTANLEVTLFEGTLSPDNWYVMAMRNASLNKSGNKVTLHGYMFPTGMQTPTLEDMNRGQPVQLVAEAKGVFVVPKDLDIPPIPDNF